MSRKYATPRKVHIGMRFGRVVVTDRAGMRRGAFLWSCDCECGGSILAVTADLNRGKVASCGCRVGSTTHGQTGSPTYKSWSAMITRCTCANHVAYHRYGGRGITICSRWRESFENFFADMGERPDGMTLDRRDSDGNYEPANCRWATATEQARNTSAIKLEPHEPEQIRWLRSIGYRNCDVAAFFEVSPSCVTSITKGRQWRNP